MRQSVWVTTLLVGCLLLGSAAKAADIPGKVTSVEDKTITIASDSEFLPVAGDAIEIFVEIEGLGPASVGTARVSSVKSNGAIVAEIVEASGRVDPGHQVTITSPKPRKRPARADFALLNVLRGHTGRVFNVAVTDDGQKVVSTGQDGTVRIWNLKTGEQEQVLQTHTSWGVGLAIVPGTSQIVTSGNDRIVRCIDLETGRTLRFMEGHSDKVWAVAMSDDGAVALSGSHDKTARLWNLRTGREVRRFTGSAGVWSVDLSPDGKLALTAGPGSPAHLWDTQTGRELRQFQRVSQDGTKLGCVAAVFSSDGRSVLAGAGKSVVLWDVETGEEQRVFEGHTHALRSIACSPDGTRAVTSSYDMTVRLWDLATGQQLARYDWPIPESGETSGTPLLFGVAYGPGEKIAVAGSDQTIRILEITTGNAGGP